MVDGYIRFLERKCHQNCSFYGFDLKRWEKRTSGAGHREKEEMTSPKLGLKQLYQVVTFEAKGAGRKRIEVGRKRERR